MQDKPSLEVSIDLWYSLSPVQQQDQREKFHVTVLQPYAPAVDLDTPIEFQQVPYKEKN